MQQFRTLLAASAATLMSLGSAGLAHGQAVRAAQDQTIDLGRVTGDIYYTVKPDGYHLVATFAEPRDDATPMRFEAILANNQSVTFSTPRHTGEAPIAVEISRHSDQVSVRKAAETN